MLIHGDAEEGFGRVVDAFRGNFTERGDLGAGCAVYVDGRKVVDLWAGVADARTARPWDEETAGVLFSSTKGIVALCAYLLVQEGSLDLDAPLTRYWPRFSGDGRDAITMRHVLAHRAGLPAISAPLTRAEICEWEPPVRALEHERPMWEPGTAHSYHPVTFGWLAGEVIRRITGLTPGAFFRRRLGDPLDLRAWIGVPESARASVAWIEPPPPEDDNPLTRAIVATQATPAVKLAMSIGEALPFPTELGIVTINDPALQAAELPGVNGIATPRSLARLYASCVSEVDGPRLLSPELVRDALVPQSWGQMLLGDPDLGQRWGTGFMLSSPPSRPMLSEKSFGHDGAGGQLGFADEAYRVGFGYVSNQMGPLLDQRANELTRALCACLGVPEPVRRDAVSTPVGRDGDDVAPADAAEPPRWNTIAYGRSAAAPVPAVPPDGIAPFFVERLRLFGDVRTAVDVPPAFMEPSGVWSPPSGVRIDEVSIDGPHGAVPVRLYQPDSAGSASRPGLIWMHGGGFSDGSLDWGEAHAVAAELSARVGAVVASVAYRLVDDQVRYPRPLDDVLAAWQWFSGAAGRMGVGSRVCIGGASAGASLAAAACVRLRDAGLPLPAGMLLAYGVFHLPVPPLGPWGKALEALPPALRGSDEAVAAMFTRYLGSLTDVPVDGVPGAARLDGMPPAALVTCEFDPGRPSSELFGDQLERAGVPVARYLARGMLHGHLNWFPSPGLPEAGATIDFLGRQLNLQCAPARPDETSRRRERQHAREAEL